MEEQKVGWHLEPDVALRKCISILNAAKTDNERLAGLLLVTQLVQSNIIDPKGRRMLFDSVGFRFINRLLETDSVPSDCSPTVFKSLAVTILACFATDEELLYHPQMTAKISFFLEVISSSGSDKIIVEESCQILSTFASSETGCELLLRQRAVIILCEILLKSEDNRHHDLILEILRKLLSLRPCEAWKEHGVSLVEFVVAKSEKFRLSQDLSKFHICEGLTSVLATADKELFNKTLEKHSNPNKWKSDIKSGLREILQSKVKEQQRNTALILTSVICELIGMEWMVENYENRTSCTSEDDFFILVTSLVSVEVRMIINHTQHRQLTDKLSLTSVCYSILEKAISFMSCCLAEDLTASMEFTLTKAFSTTAEAMNCITTYLLRVSVNQELSEMEADEQNFLYASVRLLCSWMAEETVALQQEITELLPFLLDLAEKSFKPERKENEAHKEGKRVKFSLSSDDVRHKMARLSMADTTGNPQEDQPRVITFLLPGLCHLSADEETCKVLIDRKAHVLLCEYFKFVYNKWIESKMEDTLLERRLSLLIGILLNFAVTEPVLIKCCDSFIPLLSLVIQSVVGLRNDQCKHTVLVANLVILGLMLLRQRFDEDLFASPSQQKSLGLFFEAVIQFLRKKVRLTDSTQPTEFEWNEIAEFWLLGMDILVSCLQVVQMLKGIVTESGWLEEIQCCLSDHAAKGELTQEIVEAFEKLLKETGKLKG